MAASRNTRFLVSLLVVAVGINYMDRGSLSVAKPEVSREMGLDPVQMGLLFSAFFQTYAVCQLFAGWLVDRYDVKWVYAGGFLVWTLATAGSGMVRGFEEFFVLRLALGIGESVAYPATSRIIVGHFRPEQFGLINALVDAASKMGPALSTLVGGLVVAHLGWRALFLILGLGGLLWLVPWTLGVAPQPPNRTSDTDPPRIGFGRLLRHREVWGTSLGFFCLGYVWYFLLSWLPAYLQEERGFAKERMAVLGSIPFWAMAAASLGGGWISDRWIQAGGSPTRIRKSFLVAGLSLCALFMYPAVLTHDPTLCVALLTASCASLGIYTSNAWAVTQALAGKAAAGQWSGLQNAVGNLGGVISPLLTGWIVQQTGSFKIAFGAATGILVLGVVSYLTLVPRVHAVDFHSTHSPTPLP